MGTVGFCPDLRKQHTLISTRGNHRTIEGRAGGSGKPEKMNSSGISSPESSDFHQKAYIRKFVPYLHTFRTVRACSRSLLMPRLHSRLAEIYQISLCCMILLRQPSKLFPWAKHAPGTYASLLFSNVSIECMGVVGVPWMFVELAECIRFRVGRQG